MSRYFEHYKGGKYEYLYEAIHSETLEEMVVYRPLYGEGKIWVRPKKMFFETVVVEGESKPRFRELESPITDK